MGLKKNRESGMIYQLLFLMFFTLIGLLLDVTIIVSDWGLPFLWLVISGIVLVWLIHLTGFANIRVRMYIYVFMILIIVARFAYEGDTITDVPVILCILIILLSVQDDFRLVIISALSYVVDILENIIFTQYLNLNNDGIIYERIALGTVCILGSCMISRYFMIRNSMYDTRFEEAENKLEESKLENEIFLSNMSHELRTPINAVSGVSEIILSIEPDSEMQNNIKLIHDAGKRLQMEVSNMLYYSEIRTGHFKLTNAEYEILSVINDAVNDTFGMNELKGLEFFVDMDADIPKTLYGDARRIKKVLNLLLDNSIKFTKEGGGYLYVSSREENYGINLNIDLYDTGSGMTGEQVRKAFGGVFMGETHSEREHGGLGLGLAITHGMVSEMNGFIGIDSIPGEGTHVHISIPQEVRNSHNSIEIPRKSQYKVLCYFNREKYTVPEVAVYTGRFIENIRNKIIADLRVASSLEEVREICEREKITHIYIGEWEYDMDKAFFEEKAKSCGVCVFGSSGFKPLPDTGVYVSRKPVFLLSAVNFLKSEKGDETGTGLNKNIDNEKSLRALVVDDDRMNLVVAKGMLESIGVRSDVCENGFQAIDKCSISDYDIIFMDYMMPQMNGYNTMLRIREVRNRYYDEKPIVVLTANAVSGAKEEYLRQGFDAFISKPVEIKDMKKAVDRLCRGVEQGNE